jgi:serine/threonine protein kinase
LTKFAEAGDYTTRALVINHLKQIVRGIQYLHCVAKVIFREPFRKPIIHGDLKGQNIFIGTDNKTVKIGDLDNGLLLKNGRTNIQGIQEPVGTLFFMSPEMLKCEERIGLMTDIWSFGCVALEILGKGELIYRDKDHKKLPYNIRLDAFKKELEDGARLDTTLAAEASVSSDALLNMVIIPCLSQNPKDRPELKELLSKLIEIQEVM